MYAFSVKAKTSHWDLERVRAMVAADSFLIQQTRAQMFIGGKYEDSRREMQTVVAGLSTKNFSHSQTLTWDVADVYGIRFRGGGWYLKLTIDEEVPEVAVISFHPLEAPLRTNGGEVRP
jgi:Motility quorum-sensing regulator, toxin of MqsA